MPPEVPPESCATRKLAGSSGPCEVAKSVEDFARQPNIESCCYLANALPTRTFTVFQS